MSADWKLPPFFFMCSAPCRQTASKHVTPACEHSTWVNPPLWLCVHMLSCTLEAESELHPRTHRKKKTGSAGKFGHGIGPGVFQWDAGFRMVYMGWLAQDTDDEKGINYQIFRSLVFKGLSLLSAHDIQRRRLMKETFMMLCRSTCSTEQCFFQGLRTIMCGRL